MRTKSELLSVGQITSTHGLKGEVKVYPTTDDPQRRFRELQEVILKTPKETVPVTIASVKFQKNMVLLRFKELDSIETAEKYREAYVCVTRDKADPLGENEYYEADLIGMDVSTDEGEELGILTRVLHTGANDVYEIKFRDEGRGSALIPAIRECIRQVDVDEGRMVIHVMEGLF